MTQIPQQIPRTHSVFGRFIGRSVLRCLGWQVVGQFPSEAKFVAAVAPHTSNWDFIIAIAVKLSLGIKIQFLGKKSIFFWPLGRLLRAMGGIPVDRSSAHGVVAQAKSAFDNQDALILGIAPEGTRHKKPNWKTGFLHIAKSANVPVVPMALDFRTKQFIVMPPVAIETVNDQTLAEFISLYNKNMAKYPEKMSGD